MTLAANVLTNIQQFLQRVRVEGLESFAFVEAYTAIQQELALAQNPTLAAALAAGAKPVFADPVPSPEPTPPSPPVADTESDFVPGPLDPQE